MSEKRFKLHIEWSNIDKTDGIAELSDNGQPLLETECIEDARLLQTILNEQEQKIQRWKTLYEIKDKEVTARVKRLNEICNRYKYAITFDKDIDPNDAVNILCDRILQTEVKNDKRKR